MDVHTVWIRLDKSRGNGINGATAFKIGSAGCRISGQCGVARLLPRETPAFLSYSPATGVTESSFYAFDTTSLAANIRPPPGLEHLMMDAGSRPSPLDSLDCLDPLVLPMGPLGTEPPSFPPKFAAPVDLEDTPDTPPAPPEEPCLRLALLQYLPENENADDQNKSHDTSSCRPCAFYHTKGCALGCKGRRDEKRDLKDFQTCLLCAFVPSMCLLVAFLFASQPPVSIFLSAMQAKMARNAFFAIFARLGRRSEGKNSDARQAEVLDAWLPLFVPCPA